MCSVFEIYLIIACSVGVYVIALDRCQLGGTSPFRSCGTLLVQEK